MTRPADAERLDSAATKAIKDLDKVEWQAYQDSCALKVPALVTSLVEKIGVQMTAVGAGLSDGRPVRSWQQADSQPRPNTLDRLRLLYRTTSIVEAVYGTETTRAFLRSASPYLGNRAPLEVIADDEVEHAQQEVLGAVRGFLEG